MKSQEIFDKVITHLWTQGERSTNSAGDLCKYRAPDGRRCAIGAILPDVLYSRKMEGQGLPALLQQWPETKVLLPEDMEPAGGKAFLCALQCLHDINLPTNFKSLVFIKRARILARDWKLKMPLLPEEAS